METCSRTRPMLAAASVLLLAACGSQPGAAPAPRTLCPYDVYPVSSHAGIAREGVLQGRSPAQLLHRARAQGADSVIGMHQWRDSDGVSSWTGTAIKFTDPACRR